MSSSLVGLPSGKQTLTLGSSFRSGGAGASFHAVRYDFKQGAESAEAGGGASFIVQGEGAPPEATVAVPKDPEAKEVELYKGAWKEAGERDCVLLFDHEAGTFRLERLATNAYLKKTRRDAAGAAFAAAVRRQRAGAAEPLEESSEESDDSDSDDKSSGADDELMDVDAPPGPSPSDSTERMPPPPPPSQAKPKAPNVLADDLRLSDSSDDE